VHVARQVVQRPQPLADGQPQHQRHHRQQPQAGLGDLLGNVLRQIVALALAQQHHHLALVAPPSQREKARQPAGGLPSRSVSNPSVALNGGVGAAPVRVSRRPLASHTTTLMDCW
jgi:hypothetical protein